VFMMNQSFSEEHYTMLEAGEGSPRFLSGSIGLMHHQAAYFWISKKRRLSRLLQMSRNLVLHLKLDVGKM
jgi:hypothetical protein